MKAVQQPNGDQALDRLQLAAQCYMEEAVKKSEDEDEERTPDIERKVCFVHSARLLQMADRNPRY